MESKMSDKSLEAMVEGGDWFGIAKAITFAHVSAPNNPAKCAWVSAVEEGPYHIETTDSAANGGQGFKAICGAAGDFNFHLTAAQIFPSQKCKTCVELCTKVISDVASVATGNAPDTDSPMVGDEGSRNGARRDSATEQGQNDPLLETPAAQISDRFGDDRFTDNILRALEGLPQNGDAEEEEAAADEGALIEASGYQDPAYERNGR